MRGLLWGGVFKVPRRLCTKTDVWTRAQGAVTLKVNV